MVEVCYNQDMNTYEVTLRRTTLEEVVVEVSAPDEGSAEDLAYELADYCCQSSEWDILDSDTETAFIELIYEDEDEDEDEDGSL